MRFLFLLTFFVLTHFSARAQQLRPNWVDDLGGTSGSVKVTGVAVDKQNDVYVTGYFAGTVDFDPSAAVKNLTSVAGTDIFVGKYKQDGTLIWIEPIGGDGNDQSSGLSVDKDGNISIVGHSNSLILDLDPSTGIDTVSNSPGSVCLFLIHLDTNGNFLWANPYLLPKGMLPPTDLNIYRVANDSQDGVIITFEFGAPLTIGDTTYTDALADQGLIVKYNAAGNELWAVNIAGDGLSSNEGTYDVKTDSEDNIVVSGTFGSTINFNPLGTAYNLTAANSAASYVAKYSPAGILIWANAINYPSTTFSADTSSAISIDKKNNVYFNTAFTGSITVGPTTLNASGSGNNVCIAKYSPAGVLQFAKSIGGTGSLGLVNEMACDANNNLYITGDLNGTVNFNPNTGSAQNLTAHGPQDFYVAKYDSTANYLYAFSAGNVGCANTSSNSLAINGSNNINVAGSFCSTVNFDQSGCSSDNITAVSIADGFIAQYSTGSIANNVITAPTVNSFCTSGTPAAITGSLPTGGGTYTYQWQSSTDSITFVSINGATGQNYTPATLTATTYYQRVVSSSGSGCSAVAPSASNVVTITIGTAPAAPIVAPDTTCSGSTATLSLISPQTGITYNWYTSATGGTSLFTGTSFTTPALTATTTYYVAAANSAGCSAATRTPATVSVFPILDAPVVTVGATTSSSVIFTWAAITGATGYQVSTNGGQTYTAITGLADTVSNLKAAQSVTIIVQAKGTLTCQLSTASAAVTGTATNTATNANDVVFVPNAFTPNGDGRNDILYVYSQNIKTFKFYIYDQWGELLFTSTSLQNGWDGTYKEAKEPAGVYVYYVEAVMNDGQNVKKKGTITLLK
jgi:gliding motility-associated-like protein